MKILFAIYLITVLLGALGEFFMSAQIKDTIKNSNYVRVKNTSCLRRIANILKLSAMTLIPFYNIILFITGLAFPKEKCIESIEKQIYVKENE